MRTRFILSATLAVFALGLSSQRIQAQAGGSTCKDGTKSEATGKGACSGHGGVDTKATAASKKAAAASAKTVTPTPPPAAAKTAPATKTVPPPPAASKSAAASKTVPPAKTANASDKDPTDAEALCKDGTYSHAKSHKGACSKHGGVSKFLKP